MNISEKKHDAAPRRRASKSHQTVSSAQAFAVIGIGILVISGIALPYTGWWREYHFQRASIAELERERVNHATDPVVLFYLGRRLNEQDRFPEAVKVLQAAVEADPADERSRDAWAQALLGAGRGTEALAELKQYASAYPQSASPYLLLGKFHATLEADVPAETALKEAVRLDPKKAEAWALLGDIHHRHARDKEATDALRHALELTPNDASVHLSFGRALTHIDAHAAGNAYKKASELNPTDATIRREKAEFLYNHGEPTQAETEVRVALRLKPDEIRSNLLLGRCLLDRGATGEALAPLEFAARNDPFDPIPAQYLQRLYAQTGNLSASEEWKKQYAARQAIVEEGHHLLDALLTRPADRELNRRMARHQAKVGNIEACIHYMSIALGQRMDAPEVFSAVATDLEAAGHSEAARRLRQRISEGASNISSPKPNGFGDENKP